MIITETYAIIGKFREYIDYIEDHIKNVEKAFHEITDKCKDMRFVYDDFYYNILLNEVQKHDMSKFSTEEFTDYRRVFYPTNIETKPFSLESAWSHHKENNSHHWENWTAKTLWKFPNEWEIHCAHMVIDWTAMGYKFGDTAQIYYEKNVDKIILPDYAIDFMYEIFKRLTH